MVWSIRAKLFTMVVVAAVAAAVLAGIAFTALNQVGKAVGHTASLSAAIRLQGDADMMHDAIYGNVLAGMLASVDRDAAAHAEAARSFSENAARFRKDLSGLAGIELGADTQARLRAVKPALDAYVAASEAFFRGGIAAADARATLGRTTQSYEALAEPMEKLSDSIEADIAAATAALSQRQRIADIAILIATLAGIGLIGVAGWSIGRAITAPLALAVKAVQTVAAGDLTEELPEGRRDEVGVLLHALNGMRESLSNMFVMFQAKAGELDDASHALVNAAARVTQGSAQQRDASGGIAATLEQMNSSIEAVAESMGVSRDLAQRAGDASTSGAHAIDRLIADMQRIESSVKMSASDIARLGEESRNIGAVVNVIKEIADQTNLLALNAAIEAARAGEQGRGFAVVADEVRKLAERTANSTEQIGAMIDKIVGQVNTTVKGVQEGVTMVEAGMRSAQDANAVLEDITRGVQDVVTNVNHAADAMREQASAVQHVSGSAEQITGMSEQNATVSEETEQSARVLSGIAETLRVSAAIFKVKGDLAPKTMQDMVAASRGKVQEDAGVSLF